MDTPRVTDEHRRRAMAWRHRLIPAARVDDVAAIADDLVALHSSDPTSVYLSACVRMSSPSLAAIDTALYGDRSVVRHHAMRRTLWVMSPVVARLAHASSTRKIAAVEKQRSITMLGVDEQWFDGAVSAVLALLSAADEPLTARQVGPLLPEIDRRVVSGQGSSSEATAVAHTRALLQLGFEAKAIRARPQGSWIGSQYAWTTPSAWLGEEIDDPVVDQATAASQLTARWLARFGPATATDLQWWTGWTKTATTAALVAIGAQAVVLDDGSAGWCLPDDDVLAAGSPNASDPGRWVALLPGLDPTAMGWKQRAWYLDDDVVARVVDRNGNIGPTIWSDGRVVGGWVQRRDGSVATELYRSLDRSHQRLLDDEIERIVDVVGATRFRVRFPSPNQSDLLG